MRKTHHSCPHCQSTLASGDDIAPPAAVPCLGCHRALVPSSMPAATAAMQVVPAAANAHALRASARVFAGLTVLVIAALSVSVAKAQPDARGIEPWRINAAIDKGVYYLKKTQGNPTWPSGANGPDVGFTALAGLTLLECKVPPTDPSVVKAAGFVRKHVDTFKHKWETYELALTILFLDRLGDPKDDPLIQRTAMRLLTGQTDAGGWTYRNGYGLTRTEMKQLLVFLKAHRPPGALPKVLGAGGVLGKVATAPVGLPKQVQVPGPMPGESLKQSGGTSQSKDPRLTKPLEGNAPADRSKDPPAKQPKKAAPVPLKSLPQRLRQIPVAQLHAANGKVELPAVPRGDDNSNTQFALMALWAARRHDMPAEYSLLLAQQRFIRSQNADGGWGYHVLRQSKITMTCVGLIGLAMGHGASAEDGKNQPKQEDLAIQNGLRALGAYIGTPSGEAKPPQPNLYFLWSLERVAMLYDLKTIGGKDWYAWGAQALVANQQLLGAWAGGGYPGANPHCDTCFALLFLKRSNLVADLTENLRLRMNIRDPGANGSSTSGGSSPGSSSPGSKR